MAGYRMRLKRSWKFFAAVIVPLMFLPVLFVDDEEMMPSNKLSNINDDGEEDSSNDEDIGSGSLKQSPKFKLAYVILVMAVYWALEIIPLPITSLFPLVLFPVLGIDDSANVSKSYMKESNTIFLGGAIVALAIEYCNLHRRVALRLITIVGVSPRRLMFGIMVVVSFLSMWISNTTCTTMIVPIIAAIVDEIHEVSDATEAHGNSSNPSFRNTQVDSNEQRTSYTPAGHSHTTAFSNAALSSHHAGQSNQNISTANETRSTLGLLEGHRSDGDQRARDRRNNINARHHSRAVEENNNNQPNGHHITKPLPPRRLSLIHGEQESGRISGIRKPSFDSNPAVPRSLRNSVCSIDTGRPEITVDLPSPTESECCDEIENTRLKEREKWRKIKNMYLFALAYAANIGGTATITGTGPNKVFKEVIKPYSYDISQNGKYLEMTFFTWMAFNLPPMLVNNIVAWLYLNFKYCGFPKFSKNAQDQAEHTLKRWKEKQVRSYLLDEYKKLGKMTFHEIGVATVFLLVVFLWILRDPQIFSGWHEVIVVSDVQTGDSTAALFGALLLFIIPRNWSFLTSKDGVRCEALLDWSYVTKKLPWGVLLLLGSGYAIGDSVVKTGLSKWLGEELYLLHDLPQPVLLLIVMVITAFVTEVVSNTACASVILPVLLGLSREMRIHPLYLSVPAAVTASYAFMLPVASPVNAIVFAAGDFSIWEMITNGYILNGICVVVFYINTLTLGECMFNYAEFTYPPPPSFVSEEINSDEDISFFNTSSTVFS